MNRTGAFPTSRTDTPPTMKNKKRGAGLLRAFKYALLTLATLSLVKIAFFPGGDEPQLVGDGDFSQPTVMLEKNTINNEAKLAATILRDAPTPIRATASGEITAVYVSSGQVVGQGSSLIQVKSTTTPAGAATATDDEDAAAVAPEVRYQDIPARAGGTVSMDVVIGQVVEVGQEIGTISPNSFHAMAQPKPGQLYSMGDALRSGSLSITDGPGPFLCTEVKIVTVGQTPSSGGAAGMAADDAASAGGPQIRCDIPDDQTVYEGIPATLTIGGAVTGEVNTLPVSAVEGRFNEGIVYLPADDPSQKPVRRKVQLGPNDGTNIEIKGGLREDEEVLMFVPAVSRDENDGDGTGGNPDVIPYDDNADADSDSGAGDAPAGN